MNIREELRKLHRRRPTFVQITFTHHHHGHHHYEDNREQEVGTKGKEFESGPLPQAKKRTKRTCKKLRNFADSSLILHLKSPLPERK